MNHDPFNGFERIENGLPEWKGFAWFGLLLMENRRNKTTITARAGGVYCEDGKSMRFRIEPQTVAGDFSGSFDDYDVVGYITDEKKRI
ncbi:MAG: hypothetical protein LBS05_09450 [Tannerellaceae bacterium]|jgi:hypothetical protein|nr:hypothetical protein [Tannerellaceae bacterium]